MRNFMQKHKANQQTGTSSYPLVSRSVSSQSCDVWSIGNKEKPQLQLPKTTEYKAESKSAESKGYVHEFCKIPPHSKEPPHIQPKLIVNSPGDIYEQEADWVADRVLRMTEPEAHLQVHNEIKEIVQTKSSENYSIEPQIKCADKINTLRGDGKPLSGSERSFFEPRFRHDFSHVRIHNDANAADAARTIHAKAFTIGNNIVFDSDYYHPTTWSGRHLLAHELTHVIQQGMKQVNPLMIQREMVRDREGNLWYPTREEAQRRLHQIIRIVPVEETGPFRIDWRWDPAHPEHDPWNEGTRRYDTREAAEERRDTLLRIESEEVSVGGHTEIHWYVLKDTDLRPESQQPAQPERPSQQEQPEQEQQPQQEQEQAREAQATQPGQGSGRTGTTTPSISLTFDDGPHSAPLGSGSNNTENVLNTLRDNGSIKAGFFVQTAVSIRGASRVGAQLIARMQREGHTVGIHTGGTIGHEPHYVTQQEGRLESELEAAKERIRDLTEVVPSFVRPPFGRVAPRRGTVSEAERRRIGEAVMRIYRRVGLTQLLWDIDGDNPDELGGPPTRDRLKNHVEQELRRLNRRGWRTRTASSNVVILYHDVRATTSSNLGAIIAHIRRVVGTLTGNSPRFRAP